MIEEIDQHLQRINITHSQNDIRLCVRFVAKKYGVTSDYVANIILEDIKVTTTLPISTSKLTYLSPNLNVDMLKMILQNSDLVAIKNFCNANKEIRVLCKDQSFWKFKFEHDFPELKTLERPDKEWNYTTTYKKALWCRKTALEIKDDILNRKLRGRGIGRVSIKYYGMNDDNQWDWLPARLKGLLTYSDLLFEKVGTGKKKYVGIYKQWSGNSSGDYVALTYSEVIILFTKLIYIRFYDRVVVSSQDGIVLFLGNISRRMSGYNTRPKVLKQKEKNRGIIHL